MLAHEHRHLAQDLASFDDRQRGPRELCLLRNPHCADDIRARRPRDLAEDASGRRIDFREGSSLGRERILRADVIGNDGWDRDEIGRPGL